MSGTRSGALRFHCPCGLSEISPCFYSQGHAASWLGATQVESIPERTWTKKFNLSKQTVVLRGYNGATTLYVISPTLLQKVHKITELLYLSSLNYRLLIVWTSNLLQRLLVSCFWRAGGGHLFAEVTVWCKSEISKAHTHTHTWTISCAVLSHRI